MEKYFSRREAVARHFFVGKISATRNGLELRLFSLRGALKSKARWKFAMPRVSVGQVFVCVAN
jgi:hypothetical protein